MKRWPGEPFEEYKIRRKGEAVVTKAHLRGRMPNGKYADPALHNTMKKTVSREKIKSQAIKIGWCFLSGMAGWLIGTLIYAII